MWSAQIIEVYKKSWCREPEASKLSTHCGLIPLGIQCLHLGGGRHMVEEHKPWVNWGKTKSKRSFVPTSHLELYGVNASLSALRQCGMLITELKRQRVYNDWIDWDILYLLLYHRILHTYACLYERYSEFLVSPQSKAFLTQVLLYFEFPKLFLTCPGFLKLPSYSLWPQSFGCQCPSSSQKLDMTF